MGFKVGDKVVSITLNGASLCSYGTPTVVASVSDKLVKCEDGSRWTVRGNCWGGSPYDRTRLLHLTDEVVADMKDNRRKIAISNFQIWIRNNVYKCSDYDVLADIRDRLNESITKAGK